MVIAGRNQSVRITRELVIPASELRFVDSKSSGPGGQNVNKRSTRVTLLFDIKASDALSEEQKEKLFKSLSGRISRDGILRVTAQDHRSRHQNMVLAIERFRDLVRDSLKTRKRRMKTRVPARAEERRLKEKKLCSIKKKNRGRITSNDW